jgi:hypothetical protein
MAANWNSYVSRRKMRLEDIRRTIDLLHKSGVRVVLIGQSPVFTFVYPDEYFFQVYGSQSTDHPYEGELAVDPGINEKYPQSRKPMSSSTRWHRCAIATNAYSRITGSICLAIMGTLHRQAA